MNKKGFLKCINPVLPVKNVEEALQFYVNKLGFVPAFADHTETPNYAGIRRDDIEIHLQWHDAEEWEVAVDRPMLRITVNNIEELYNEYEMQGVFHENTKLRKTPWGTKEFAFYDPFKNGLTFYVDL